MRGRWPRRAGWARIGERIGVRRSSGGSAPSSRCGKRWWGRGPRYISVVRSLLRREGVGVRSGGSSSFVARVGELLLPQWLESEIAPLLAVMEKLNEEIHAADDRLAKRANTDAVVRRLCTAPGVGVVTAIAFRATLDEAARFRGAHQHSRRGRSDS
jgi:transposase